MSIGMLLPVLLPIGAVIGWGLTRIPARRRGGLERRIDTMMSSRPLSPAAKQDTGVRMWWLEWFARLLKMPVDLPLANVAPPIPIFGAGTALACGSIWFGRGMTSWPLSIAAGLVVWVVLVRGVFAWERDRYQTRLRHQLPDTIRLAVSTIRAGLPVIEAFRAITEEMASPTRDEFMRVEREMALGSTPADALLALNERTRVSEYAIFAVSIGVQGRSGGNFTETMQTLAETVQQRLAVATRAKALAVRVKLTAIIMCVLAVVAALGLSTIRPRSIHIPFHEAAEARAFVFAILLLLLGVAIMRQIIRAGTRD